MKHLFFVPAAALLFASSVCSQEQQNTLRLEFYQQVKLANMDQFNNDDWDYILYPSTIPYHTEFTRNYFAGAFGIGYEKVLKNDLIVRPRIGVTFRKLKETYHNDYHHQQDEGPDDYISDQSYDYDQQHLNCFFGLAKRFPLFTNFSMDLGVDLAWVHYFKSRSIHYIHTVEYYPDSEDIYGIIDYWQYHGKAPVDLFGLGPQLAVNYTIGDHWLLSAGAETFFSYVKINGDNSFRLFYTQDTDSGFSTIDYYENKHYKIGQFEWSVISPMVSVGYRF